MSLQCLRVFFPLVYTYREASGLTSAAVVGVLVFMAPMSRRCSSASPGRGRRCWQCGALGGMRVADPGSRRWLALGAVAAGTGLVALGVVVVVVRNRGASSRSA